MAVLLVFIRPVEGKGDKWQVSEIRRKRTSTTDCKSHGEAYGLVKVLVLTNNSMLVIAYSRMDRIERMYAIQNGRTKRIEVV